MTRLAVITGGSSDIGIACALTLFDRNRVDRVILVGRDESRLDAARQKLGLKNKLQTDVEVTDLTTVEGAKSFRELMNQHEQLDVLVNCVGGFLPGNFNASSPSVWRKAFDTNLFSVIAATRMAFASLKHGSEPAVINISSVFALHPRSEAIAYSCAKGALVTMTKCLAADWGKFGIRVNCVCPSFIDTRTNKEMIPEGQYDRAMELAAKSHPIGRVGTPEDVAQAVYFLCSPELGWVTGAVLPVDGGMTSGPSPVLM